MGLSTAREGSRAKEEELVGGKDLQVGPQMPRHGIERVKICLDPHDT